MREGTGLNRQSATPIGPDACALCVGLPLTFEDVQACARRPSDFGYVPGILAGRTPTPSLLNDLWRAYRVQVVEPIEAACVKFEAMGVAVRRRGTLRDLGDLAQTKRAIVLWTHWESQRFAPNEVKDPLGVVQAAEGSDWIGTEVRQFLQPAWSRLVGRNGRAALKRAIREGREREFVADGLNRLLDCSSEARRRSMNVTSGSLTKWIRGIGIGTAPKSTRVLIERRFGCDMLSTGRPLELADGLQSVPRVLSAIPQDRWLILDLTLCNSTELAEIVRLERTHARVIGNYQKTDVASGAMLIDQTLVNLFGDRLGYLEARALAVRHLAREFGDE